MTPDTATLGYILAHALTLLLCVAGVGLLWDMAGRKKE